MMTSKFFGGVRGFAIAGNSMRTRIFLFLFFASTSGLWAQQARQVREVREERGEEVRVQEAKPVQGDIDRGAGAPAATDNNGRIVNRRIRVGGKKDEEVQAQKADIRLETFRKALNGPGGGGNGGGNGSVPAEAVDVNLNPLVRLVPVFVRGDVNGDGQINMQDAVAIVQWWNQASQFVPVQWQPSCCPWMTNFPCHDAADADDDGYLTKHDARAIILYLWANVMLPPPSSFSINYITSDCGEDLTGDGLGCDTESVVCE